jgi:SHS2 domain-containing protein
MYEIFEHTADFGLRARAEELNTLFAEAARALFALMVSDLGSVRPSEERTFELRADGLDDLLHDWLNELLYTFATEHRLFSQFEVQLQDATLRATARGEPVNRGRHQIEIEVKAITYHGLKVVRDPVGWLAEVIVDT